MSDSSCQTVITGYAHYLQLSDEWNNKPMMDIETLGTVWLTHKPNKMMEELRSSARPFRSFKKLIAEHPEMEKMYDIDWEKEWASSKPEYYGHPYESDLWGDDWNDCPAECNAGRPYGGNPVTIEAGDFVIVIKNNSSHTTVKGDDE